jgi:hypothetical protein
MSCNDQVALTIVQGETFTRVVRWEAPPFVYKAIAAIAAQAPARLTVPAHDLPDGWRGFPRSVKGMLEINGRFDDAGQPLEEDFHKLTVVDPNTIDINGIDASGFSPYTSGGYLQCYTPVTLTGYTARMKIKDRIGGTTLLELTTENGGIAIDNTAKTITLTITATATAAITWLEGEFDLELMSGAVVTRILKGTVSVCQEVTTTA